MEQEIEAIDGVKDVHHVHIWQYSEKIIIFDGHIDFEDQLLSEIEKIYPRIISLLKLKYGITCDDPSRDKGKGSKINF